MKMPAPLLFFSHRGVSVRKYLYAARLTISIDIGFVS